MEKQKVIKIVADNIRDIMNSKGISNPELARRINGSSGTISKVVNGKMAITIPMAVLFAEGLDVALSEITNGLELELGIKKRVKTSVPREQQLSIGVLSINNKRICCVKNKIGGDILGQSELETGLDLAETSSSLIQMIKEAIFTALKGKNISTRDFRESHLKLVTQSYEFEDARYKFISFAKKHFKDVLLIPDWQITYLTAFKKGQGISLVTDKGISLSYLDDHQLKKIGGWKFPVYDLGGENWLGDETIKHTIEAREGYIPMTGLARMVLSKFNGKIERITEACFKGANADVYSTFCDILLRAFFTGDEAAKELISRGFESVKRTVDVADKNIGQKLKIAIHGSLAGIYKPFFEEGRTMASPNDVEKVQLLVDITREFLIDHGINEDTSNFQ